VVVSERLAGSTAIVTGGARGLGAAIVARFIEEGARVVVTDVRLEEGVALVRDMEHATFVRADVADEADWRTVIEACVSTFGPPDILVANAFASSTAQIEDETRLAWDRTLAVSLTGAFLGMRAVIPLMRERGGGSIVSISSTHGGNVAIPVQAAYQAAKGGLTALTRNAAVAYARDNIRANAVHPGPIRTPLVEELGLVEEQERIASTLPIGRVASPAEVASAVAYLASREASYVTGTSFVIDGGYTAL
jgi:3alpha(or 20beta)-hydroxysteroid dehydrogenase